MMKSARSNSANDVNGAAANKSRRPASGRERSRAPSVVTQRKPFSKLDVRAALKIGTWNVRTLLEPGAARLLVDELEAAHVAIMGLQQVRWSDSVRLQSVTTTCCGLDLQKRNPVKAE